MDPIDITPEGEEAAKLETAAASAPLHVESAPHAAPAAKNWYAQRRIEHDGTSFEADGRPLPANFPPDSLKRLILEKSVGEKPPGETKVTQQKYAPFS